MPLTITGLDTETVVIEEVENVAVSANPLGMVVGVQFVAVFQMPVAGLDSQVASPALAGMARIRLARPKEETTTRNLQNVLISTGVMGAGAPRDTRSHRRGHMPNGI